MNRTPYRQRRRRVKVCDAPKHYIEAIEARDAGNLELAFRHASKAYACAPSSPAAQALLLELARKVKHPSLRRRRG